MPIGSDSQTKEPRANFCDGQIRPAYVGRRSTDQVPAADPDEAPTGILGDTTLPGSGQICPGRDRVPAHRYNEQL